MEKTKFIPLPLPLPPQTRTQQGTHQKSNVHVFQRATEQMCITAEA